MNNTKWERLISKVILNDTFEPRVNIKFIFDTKVSNVFSIVHWDEVRLEGYKLIEWIKINPIKEEYLGTLVEPKYTDYSQLIETKLIQNHIPYEYDDKVFIVYGYKR